jgi:hypothetical protein
MSTALCSGLSLPFSTLARFLLGVAALLPAAGWAVEGGTNNTITTSTSSSQSVIFSGTGMASFLTRLQAIGQQPPGFDLSFDKAFGDSTVQSAIAAARKILTNAGVPGAIANQGPVRIGSALTAFGLPGAVLGSTSTQVVTLEDTIGPGTIIIGNRDIGGTAFAVLAGTSNLNVNTHTQTEITQSRGGSLQSETYVIPIDFGAVLSLANSALPVALVQREALLAIEQAAGRDINGRLFRLRAGSVRIRSEGDVDDGPDGNGRWEFFASGDFGNAAQGQRGQQTAFGSDTWAATVGAEAGIAPGLTLGLAATWLENRTVLGSDLGSLDIEGFALAAYASYVRAPFYADLLYRFGDYEDRIRRNTLYGATAHAAPQAYMHTVEFHTGANFKLGPVTTGPMLGVAYTHGTLDGYTETGAGSQNTSVGTQRYDSLKTQVGWQASRRVPLQKGAVTCQLRAFWERENLNAPANVGVSLVDSPLYALDANGALQRTGGLTLSGTTTRAGDDYIALGGGVLFEIDSRTKVMLDYEEHLARAGRSERTGAIRVSVAF